jgi:hypothetical protein
MKTLRTQLASVLILSVVCSAASAQTNYYLRQSQASGWNWHTTIAGNLNSWHTTASGTAVQATAMDAAAHYFTNGFTVRSPENSATNVFGGAKLILNGGGLSLKTTNGSALASVGWLETQGSATITAANANNQYHSLSATIFDNGGTTTFSASDTRSFNLTFADLNGSGGLIFAGGGTASNFNLNIGNAADFAGSFSLNGGTLRLAANLAAPAASLSIASGTLVNLSHSVSVNALSIAGTTLANGTYSYAWLNTNYGSIFTAGSVNNGSITVGTPIPEPSALAALAGLGALGFVAARRRRR